MKSKQVLELLRKIPRGRVTTYKALAERAGTSPRAVGQIMARNTRPDYYPCFKVVCSDGRLGGYALGQDEKIKKLKKDGVEIRDRKVGKSFFWP